MIPFKLLAILLLLLVGAVALAEETVGVAGSSARFPARVKKQVDGQPVSLVLTGTAMRTKSVVAFSVNVYAVGCYVAEDAKLNSAEDLAKCPHCKQLHLVMERDVAGSDVAASFTEAIRNNYPAPAYQAEVRLLTDILGSVKIEKGDQILLTHIPNVGLQCELVGKTQRLIKNKDFPKAIWDIYLGPKNLGPEIKTGLTSRL
jgi:hypothetical protein